MGLKIGDNIETVRAINLEPDAIIERGERGKVIDIDENVFGQTGVWIKLKKLHTGLPGNVALLVMPELAYVVASQPWFTKGLAWFFGGVVTTLGTCRLHLPQLAMAGLSAIGIL